MAGPIILPVKLLGWAAAGVALGFGWQLGSYLVRTAAGDKHVKELIERIKCGCGSEDSQLWKRQFSKISE